MAENKKIAIVGNPNCGKTTLFNGLTNGHVKTGNWPGVTVEKLEGIISYSSDELTIVDLPGIYSFYAASEDEKAAREFILSRDAEFIINIVDAGNLERNLYLTTQLLEMGIPVFIIVNMKDVAEKNGIKVDIDKLSKDLSVPVESISALNKDDIERVKQSIYKYLSECSISNSVVEYPNEIEDLISIWKSELSKNDVKSPRWTALKYLNRYSGNAVTVTDEEIINAQSYLSRKAGLFTEPAGAASWAGLLKIKAQISSDETVVVLATGSGLKDTVSASKGIIIPEKSISSIEDTE